MRLSVLFILALAGPAAAAPDAGADCSDYYKQEDCVPFMDALAQTAINDYTLTQSTPSFVFVDDKHNEVGKLSWNGQGQFFFTGNADEAARVFFKYLSDHMEGWMRDRCGEAPK